MTSVAGLLRFLKAFSGGNVFVQCSSRDNTSVMCFVHIRTGFCVWVLCVCVWASVCMHDCSGDSMGGPWTLQLKDGVARQLRVDETSMLATVPHGVGGLHAWKLILTVRKRV